MTSAGSRGSIDRSTARDLLTTLSQLRWSWSVEELPQVMERLDWHVVAQIEGRGAVADAPWNVGEQAIDIGLEGHRVDTVTIGLSEVLLPETTGSRAFTQDRFVDIVAVGSHVLGPSTSRVLGEYPNVRWRGSETTITVTNLWSSVALVWATNEAQDRWDQSFVDER